MDEFEPVPTYMLTTIDNPFHPLKEYDEWLRYDEDHGHYTWNFVTRVAGTGDYLSEAENQRAINSAIDEILAHDIECKYRKVLIDEPVDSD